MLGNYLGQVTTGAAMSSPDDDEEERLERRKGGARVAVERAVVQEPAAHECEEYSTQEQDLIGSDVQYRSGGLNMNNPGESSRVAQLTDKEIEDFRKLRRNANMAYKSGKFEDAINLYTSLLNDGRFNYCGLYSQRSNAFIKVESISTMNYFSHGLNEGCFRWAMSKQCSLTTFPAGEVSGSLGRYQQCFGKASGLCEQSGMRGSVYITNALLPIIGASRIKSCEAA